MYIKKKIESIRMIGDVVQLRDGEGDLVVEGKASHKHKDEMVVALLESNLVVWVDKDKKDKKEIYITTSRFAAEAVIVRRVTVNGDGTVSMSYGTDAESCEAHTNTNKSYEISSVTPDNIHTIKDWWGPFQIPMVTPHSFQMVRNVTFITLG